MAVHSEVSTGSDALHLAGALVLLVRALEQRLRASAGAEALTLTEMGILGQIDRGVDAPSQIARQLRLDPARVTHVTDRLVGAGYIARESNPDDRRRCQLRLTEAGTAWLRKGRRNLSTATEALLGDLSPDERAGLVEGLDGVRRVLSSQPDPAGVS
jgi:DNA-binding MarR family transcriptional regulator